MSRQDFKEGGKKLFSFLLLFFTFRIYNPVQLIRDSTQSNRTGAATSEEVSRIERIALFQMIIKPKKIA